MIQELIELANQQDLKPGEVYEVHASGSDVSPQGIIHVGEFIDRWWDAIEVLKDFQERHHFCCNCDDERYLGIVHDDGAFVVELRPAEVNQ